MSIRTLFRLATGATTAVALAISALPASAGTMRLGMTTWVGYGPMFLARDKGFFKENGLDVDLHIIEDASIYMAAVASGQLDGNASTLDEIMKYRSPDFCFKVVAALDDSHGGDGVLVLWNVSRPDENARRNIIVTGREICLRYAHDFYPMVSAKVTDAPPLLRCGLARGTVYSIGDGEDFVGSCINMAARIQKLPGTSFAFNRRGINIDDPNADDFFHNGVVTKKISVRGIGDNELICILKSELDAMNADDRREYRDL